MDADLVIITIMVITVVAIIGGSVNGIVAKVIDYKKSQNLLDKRQDTDGSDGLSDRTEMIEDRLRVLERIATDRGQLLSDEIESLRGSMVEANNKEAN